MKINPQIMAMSMQDLIKLRDNLEGKVQLDPDKYTTVYNMTQRAIEAKVI